MYLYIFMFVQIQESNVLFKCLEDEIKIIGEW